MSNAVDMATKLNATTAGNLAKNGITHVGRYLGHDWKGLTVEEVSAIKAAGLNIWSIFERSGNSPISSFYFTAEQAKQDAIDAYNLAKELGQPEGTAIYFTVDYDCTNSDDCPKILSYFQVIANVLKSYKVGAYGCFDVLNYLHSHNAATFYFQTVAWSGGQKTNFNHIYQCECDKAFAGLQVDFNDLEQDEVGAWGQPKGNMLTTSTVKPLMVVKALGECDIRSLPNHSSGFIRNTYDGEILNVWEIQGDWHRVAAIPEKNIFGWIDGNNGKNLYWLDNPNLSQPQPIYHMCVVGDTAGKLAQANGVTIDQIKTWNNLDANYTIYAGQKLRVR